MQPSPQIEESVGATEWSVPSVQIVDVNDWLSRAANPVPTFASAVTNYVPRHRKESNES
jgi:hypothetical protein